MDQAPQPAADNDAPMAWIWSGVFVFVFFLLKFVTPWHQLAILEATGDDWKSLLWVVAGYTLPLTVGFAICGFILFRWIDHPEDRRMHPLALTAACIAVLAVCGYLAQDAGLGLPPATVAYQSGHPIVAIGLWVLRGYWNAYGWSLMLCALAIGGAVALQLEVTIGRRWPQAG
jgi:hypothetical protein